MEKKHFVSRCLIDGQPNPATGEPYLIHVVTHGRKAHEEHHTIKTADDALLHFQMLATNHQIEDEDGVRYVSHIDGEGNEHTINEIEPAEEYDSEKHGTDTGNRVPEEVLMALGKSGKAEKRTSARPLAPAEALAAVLKSSKSPTA